MLSTLLASLLGGVTVSLPAESEVRGIELSLGSVAEVTGDDAELVERVRRFELGNAPTPGYSRLVHRARIEQRLRAALPEIDLHFEGADSCRVLPLVELVEGAQVAERALAELQRLFEYREVAIEALGKAVDLRVSKGVGPIELRVRLRDRELRPGDWNVPVEILVDGIVYQTLWTSWKVDFWESRPVLVRDVLRGETLEPTFVEIRRVRTSRQVSEVILTPAALSGAQALRDLREGSVINAHDVQRPMVITRGDLVSLEVKSGGVVVRSLAEVLQNGRVGDRVRIRIQNTGRELAATVVSRKQVEISMSGGSRR